MAKDSIKPKKGKLDAAAEAAASGPLTPPRLREVYETKVRAGLIEKFGLTNPMQHPRVTTITLNVSMGRHLEGTKLPPNVKTTVLETLTKISGQRPVVIKAKKSVSNFKVRAGYDSAAMVTLRRDRMWYFLDRLINLAAPRIKDFRGVSEKAFDRQGNYSMGLQEQGVFPEIDMAAVNFTHGMNIVIQLSNSTPEISRYILEELGMPFAKKEENKKSERAA